MLKSKKRIKESIVEKNRIKKYARKCFDIVKKYIDELDLMGLLALHCPKDEYEFEVAEIVQSVSEFSVETKDKKVNILSDIIIRVFSNSFDQNFAGRRDEIERAASKILDNFKLLSPFNKETYFIPKDLLPGSCYFEFQPGKYNVGKHWFSKMGEIRLDSSIYLYGDDDGIFEHSAIAPFAYLISGSSACSKIKSKEKFFDYYGITLIDENDGKKLVKQLREFSTLLGEGKQIYEALEKMKAYNSNVDGSWREEDSMEKLDVMILKKYSRRIGRLVRKGLVRKQVDFCSWNLRYFKEN
ncbi:MAG: hypothetical protein LBU60_05330 [Clostridiales bacterium]|jgi:hypothetical protein|nr:hypothetical protein [Clostridiales bacterium]